MSAAVLLQRHAEPMRQDVETAFKEAAREKNSMLHEGPYPFEDMDEAALRALLLRIKTQDASGSRDIMAGRCVEIAHALGKKDGMEGVGWIGEHLPLLYRAAMDGWAAVDPSAAFEVIVSNQRFNPCSPETLTALLQQQAETDRGALAAAVERVPWQLFLSEDGAPEALRFKDDSDVRPWLESGVLSRLMEQHIGMRDFFTAWVEQDPGGAIAGWRRWPVDDERGLDRGLQEILASGSQSEEQAVAIDRMIANSDAATSARFVEVTKRLIENGPFYDFYETVEKFPHLHELTKAPEPSEAEEHEHE